MLPATRLHGEHFCPRQYGSIVIYFYVVVYECEAKKPSKTYDENRFSNRMASQGHSRSSILKYLESRHVTNSRKCWHNVVGNTETCIDTNL